MKKSFIPVILMCLSGTVFPQNFNKSITAIGIAGVIGLSLQTQPTGITFSD
jgi:hypothetical protein